MKEKCLAGSQVEDNKLHAAGIPLKGTNFKNYMGGFFCMRKHLTSDAYHLLPHCINFLYTLPHAQGL
mgnify:CR=1 FL=1